jgi:hypothetical protein
MKRILLSAGILGMLAIGPASAALTLDFGTGSATSPSGNCTITTTSAVCANVGIGILTVSGDGAANGTYIIDGGTAGTEGGIMTLNSTTNTITIVGSIDCHTGSGTICTSMQDSTNAQLVASGTTLLSGTGTFQSFSTTTPTLGDVSFSDIDSKSSTLLTALGLTSCQTTMCSGWVLTAFTLTTNTAGSSFTSISTDVLDTAVPEPTSVLLLGTILVGAAMLMRRRAVKA